MMELISISCNGAMWSFTATDGEKTVEYKDHPSWLLPAEVKAFNDGFNFAVAAMTEQGSET